MLKTLTVFTPTYNRADTLARTYASLCRQTCSDFEWLVIDDGSMDDTEAVVGRWVAEHKIPIRYIKKENGGLHTGYNVAIQNIDTELCVCCDSDDYLPDNAVEIIVNTWRQHGNNKLAGIIGLDFFAGTDEPIGGYFKQLGTFHFLDLQTKLKHFGDTKMVLRTEILKPHVPMPSFSGEKNFNPIYIYLKVDPDLEYYFINENLCFVDYQPNGMTANIYKQFMNSPRSFAEIRKVRLIHPRISLRRKFIDAGHLISSAMIAGDMSVLKNAPKKWLCVAAIPLGLAIYLIIKKKTR